MPLVLTLMTTGHIPEHGLRATQRHAERLSVSALRTRRPSAHRRYSATPEEIAKEAAERKERAEPERRFSRKGAAFGL